jgi:hypothetical protein
MIGWKRNRARTLHPYQLAPDIAFWSRSVAQAWNPHDVIQEPLLSLEDRIVSAGSCFAANIIPYLTAAGFTYIKTEQRPKSLNVPAENLNYDTYSAAYGNVYTARQMLQLLLRATGQFTPQEEFWFSPPFYVDPFRPGLRYKARSQEEFRVLTRQHLNAVVKAFETADVFIFTVGLTEAWSSRLDGSVYPACPGAIAGEYDPAKHQFLNFTVSEVRDDLMAMVILTVSPVPLIATLEKQHVLTSTIYSKSVLRVAVQEATSIKGVSYFPAYEIVTGPQAPHDFFEEDRRTVSKKAIDAVMSVFLNRDISAEEGPESYPSRAPSASELLVAIECEEAAVDRI